MNFSLYITQLVILVLINIIAISLGIVVYASNRKGGQNRWFLAISFAMMLWVNLAYSGYVSSDINYSLMAYKLNWATVSISLFIFYYFFVSYFLKEKNDHKTLNVIVLIFSLIFALLSISTDLVISSVSGKNWGMELTFGPLSLFFNAFAIIMSCIVLYLGVKKYSFLTKIEKQRTKYFFTGVVVFIFANIIFNILVPFVFNTSEYQLFGDFSVIFFLFFAAYAILRFGLLDVRLAVVRSVTYSFVIVALSAIYFGITTATSLVFDRDIAGFEQMVTGMFASLIMAFAFQPLKRFFDKITNKIFYKDNYSQDDFFARLNRMLSSTNNLRGLLGVAANEIASTLKSEQAFFYIHTSDGHFITAGTDNHTKIPRNEALELQIVDEMDYGLFIASLRDDNDPVRRLMVSYGIELILPLKKANIIGYLCLGNHLTSHYTNKDIRVLNTISDGLVIAIQNALAIQEVRELNTNLQQKINNATRELRNSNMMLRKLDKIKDEFVSIASHQLRTPLTSVKGYISMILDGDAGKINNQQRELLGEAFISSERMVHLINDFLNVSRLQTGKFMIDKKPTDLSKVVGEEIDSLRPSAVSRGIEFIYKPPKDIPILDIDEGKIRQVIMNFADNSLYYSDKDTKVKIDLHIEDNEIVFTVKDRGIGVPKNEQAQLFSKFYRASNARLRRPDGTGVGLFLAKKVIDAHKGQIVFESSEGKGSTFGFRLPIAENNLPSPESSE